MVQSLQRFAWFLTAAAGVALLVFGVWEIVRSKPARLVEVEDANLALDGLAAARSHKVTFYVVNHAPYAVRILGGGGKTACGRNCCLAADGFEPVQVPARGRTALTFTLDVVQPGEFHDEITLYVEEQETLREFKLTVRGNAIHG